MKAILTAVFLFGCGAVQAAPIVLPDLNALEDSVHVHGSAVDDGKGVNIAVSLDNGAMESCTIQEGASGAFLSALQKAVVTGTVSMKAIVKDKGFTGCTDINYVSPSYSYRVAPATTNWTTTGYQDSTPSK